MENIKAPFLRVIGSADSLVSADSDHSCLCLNDEILIDACPSVVTALLKQDADPANIRQLFFTHMHSDHCMGLLPLLLYWKFRGIDPSQITLYGPAATLREHVHKGLAYMDMPESEAPDIVEIEGDGKLTVGGWSVSITNADHAVPGLSYRFDHTESGKSLGVSGDTMYQAKYGEFFRSCDLLLYEASFAERKPDIYSRHSNSEDAAKVANEAGVKKLLVTHCRAQFRDNAMRVAAEYSKMPAEWAVAGNIYEL